MHVPRQIPNLLLLLLFLTALVLANPHPLPKPLKPTTLHAEPSIDTSKSSTSCKIIGMWPFFNRYRILATDWDSSEGEVKSVVSEVGAMGNWKWKDWGKGMAMIDFNLDVMRTAKLEKALNRALGLDGKAENAVRCEDH